MKQADSTRNHFSRDLIISQPYLTHKVQFKKNTDRLIISLFRKTRRKKKDTLSPATHSFGTRTQRKVDGGGIWIKGEGPR